MTAYIIVIRERTTNPEELQKYRAGAGSARGDHAMTTLAAYGRQEVLEGPDVEGVVIISFPTFEEAQAWYRSPAYQEVVKHRFAGSESRALIVEGVS